MSFEEQLQEFSKKLEHAKNIKTEEATKMTLILPFFQLLGYDVFNPIEFVPEYTADVGTKRGEKVDYAIMKDGQPIILIEAKYVGEKLKKHTSQLYRYFSVTPAKFAILTNGKVYKFYSDLVEPNKMDENPFLEVDLSDIKPAQLNELQKFSKDVFDVDLILGAASELRYIDEFKSILRYEFEYPSDELVRFFLKDVYEGVKTKNVVDKYRPILHKAMQLYIGGDTGITFNSSSEVPSSIEQSDCLDPIYSDILHRLGYDIENTENCQHILKDNEIVAKAYLYKHKKQIFMKSNSGIFFKRYVLYNISPNNFGKLFNNTI
nr:MAG TPA: hypothetical protein [Caudoviricetes sp.]